MVAVVQWREENDKDADSARTAVKRFLPVRRLAKPRYKEPKPASKLYRCADIDGIDALSADPCAYCGDPSPTTHDHVLAISRGGKHELSNIVRCCWPCNRHKNSRPVGWFLTSPFLAARRGKYDDDPASTATVGRDMDGM